MNAVGRALLLNLVILPTRPAKSAEAYRKIWSAERGSPLLYHSEDLVARLRERLGPVWHVELGMRYGEPSLPSAVERLVAAGCDDLVVIPLYPQYSSAATGSSLEEVHRVTGARWVVPNLRVVCAFHDDPGFLESFAAVARPILDEQKPDHVLMSFHGLPERQVLKADATRAHCLRSEGCCDQLVDANRNCYRAQSYATARGIAERLGLAPTDMTVCFQSRLGRTPWIRPYTDVVLPELAKAGKRRLAVLCPAFVADCLETVEEIGIRAQAQWQGLGGESLRLVPSLNATPVWVETVAAMALKAAAR
jgi:protoporphyrin/coproporphyrin ferrochelatase